MADTESYAASVVGVLREHFRDLADPMTAIVVTDLVERQARDPQPGFEVIVDDPISAKWRLKPDPRDRRRVRLACYRVRPGSIAEELERTVNDALRALEADR